jgi:hypothetical protein
MTAEPSSSRPAIHYANNDLVVATWRCVLISIWKRHHIPEYAAARGLAGDILARNSRGPLALFTLVLDTATLPDDPTRDALARVRLQQCFRRVVACAGVAEGEPLRAAALRAVSIDLDQRAPPPFPTRMFNSRVDSIVWITDSLARAGERSVRGQDLLSAIATCV